MSVLVRAILWCLLSQLLIAQVYSQTVSGYILSEKGDILPYATVKLKLDSLGISFSFSVANKYGFYKIDYTGSKSVVYLEVSCVGYESKILPIKIGDSSISRNIQMTVSKGLLPEIFIKTDPPIKISGDTISFKTKSFIRGNESNLGDLLKSMPGFEVLENGKLAFEGRPISRILIEDDDITGNHYEGIIAKLKASGIDKIEVIKNYKDPDNISNINSSREQVLNLKYKNSFLGKLFGYTEVGYQPPSKNDLFNLQAIALKKRIKSLLFSEKTSFQDNLQKNSLIQYDSSPEDISEISTPEYPGLSEISDLKTSISNSSLIYKNRITQSSLNSRIQLSKKLLLKSNLNFESKRYFQSFTSQTKISSNNGVIDMYEREELKKMKKILDGSMVLNFRPNNSNQFVIVFKAENHPFVYSGIGISQGTNVTEGKDGDTYLFNFKATYNRILRKNSFFSLENKVHFGSVSGVYTFSPAGYNTFFHSGNPSDYIIQKELQKPQYLKSTASYRRKLKNNILIGKIDFTNQRSSLENWVSLHNGDSTIFVVNPDSINSRKLIYNQLNGQVQDVLRLNNKILLTMGLQGSYSYLHIFNMNKSILLYHDFHRIALQPIFSSSYEITKESKLTIEFNTENKFPDIRNVGSGYVIERASSIIRLSDTVQLNRLSTLHIFYSYADLINKGILLFTGFNLIKTPIFYQPNQFPNLFYTLSVLYPTDKYINISSFYVRTEKFVPHFHYSKFSTTVNLLNGRAYSMTNSIESLTHFRNLKIGGTINLSFKSINTQFDASFESLSQQSNLLLNRTRQVYGTLKLNLKIASILYTGLDISAAKLFPYHSESRQLMSINSNIQIKSKNQKWQYSIIVNNLTNRNFYSFTTVTYTRNTLTEYRLYPRYFLFTIGHEF